MTRPVFAATNFPLTELRPTCFLLVLFPFRELAAFVVFLTLFDDCDLEVFDALTLRALVVAFFGISPSTYGPYYHNYMKRYNARITRLLRNVHERRAKGS
jgi:hypothetical protein